MKTLLTLFVLLFSSSVFAGCISGDCVSGYGVYEWNNGAKYVGEWKYDKRIGQGTFTFPDGAKYVGEWKYDKRNGQGTFTTGGGAKYVGEWKNDKMDGQGTLTYASGDKYVGEYKSNLEHGLGTYTYANGEKYVGEFKDGKMHGQGTSTFVNGNKYVGEWKSDLTHGQGTLTYPDGTIENGIWKSGKLIERNNKIVKSNEEKRIAAANNSEKTKISPSKNKSEDIGNNSNLNDNASPTFDKKGYANCILENMKDISSDEAAKTIKEACTYKFSSGTSNSETVLNSKKNTATYTGNTIGIVSLPKNLNSCGSITTTRFPIYTGC